MAYSNANIIRLTGKLIGGKRRYILQCVDENVWRLNFLDVEIPEGVSEVIIEGAQTGVDAIDMDWIGTNNKN